MSTLADATLTAREQTILGLRRLADLLEGRADLPVPYSATLTSHIHCEDQADQIARIFDLADTLGIPVTRYEIQGHYVYSAVLPIAGSISYELYARGEDVPSAPRDHMVVTREDVLGAESEAPKVPRLLDYDDGMGDFGLRKPTTTTALETAGGGSDGAPC